MGILISPFGRLAGVVRWLAAQGALLGLVAMLAGTGWTQSAPPGQTIGPSGLPVPRYASLKADMVNLRRGPGTEYPTSWVFQRLGLPVEVINEFETWRQVRDAEGTTGWVLATMLSGRRTGLILPWEVKSGGTSAILRDDDRSNARPVAQVEAGVLVGIVSCDGTWCRVSASGVRGYIEQAKLWGVYKNESIK